MGDYYGACRALEKAYEERKALAIGVSNFSNGRVQDLILHNKIIPAVNQIQMNPFHPAKDQVEWLSKRASILWLGDHLQKRNTESFSILLW